MGQVINNTQDMNINNFNRMENVNMLNHEHFENAYSKQTSTLEFITPEKARLYLLANTSNRPASRKIINYYKSMIIRGLWNINGETIKFSEKGTLIDGQHRLIAISECGIGIGSWVIRGLSDESFASVDNGKKRTMSDILAIEDIPNYACVSSILSMYFSLKLTGQGSNSVSINADKKLAKSDILNEYKSTPDLYQTACKEAKKYSPKLCGMLKVSEIGGIISYLIKDKGYSIPYVMDFFMMLYTDKPSENRAIDALRDALTSNEANKRKIAKKHKNMLIAKAWNCYTSGKVLVRLNYNEEKEGLIKFK